MRLLEVEPMYLLPVLESTLKSESYFVANCRSRKDADALDVSFRTKMTCYFFRCFQLGRQKQTSFLILNFEHYTGHMSIARELSNNDFNWNIFFYQSLYRKQNPIVLMEDPLIFHDWPVINCNTERYVPNNPLFDKKKTKTLPKV